MNGSRNGAAPDLGESGDRMAERDGDQRSALEVAQAIRDRGWRPFPLEYRTKDRPLGKWPTMAASAPADGLLAQWFPDGQARNVGIACGPSGLVVLDEDEVGALAKLCADHGQDGLPVTYTVRTGKGRHLYYDAPAGQRVGNRARVGGHPVDVRGDGGYVLAAGSLHPSGALYVAEDGAAPVAHLPAWLVPVLARTEAPGALEPAGVPALGNTPAPGSFSGARSFTAAQARDYLETQARAPLAGAVNGTVNDTLNRAAVVAGHFVPAFWTAGEADSWVAGVLMDGPGRAAGWAAPDETDRGTIRSGLAAGMREPYARAPEFLEPAPAALEAPEDYRARRVAEEVERLEIREEAAREVARRRRKGAPHIADGLLDDLDGLEPPAMLLGSLIPDRTVGFLAGRSGAYKSFLAVAWGCSVATGRPWLGRPEFAVLEPRKVLYVAAEGAAGVAGRIRAWEAANGVSRRGQLQVYPRPVHLTDPAQVAELEEVVAAGGYGLLIVDTYHRSAPGAEENSATEFGPVFEAAARLRDDHGCGVLFVDHTGHGSTGRPRGTSAKGDDADYVLSATYEGDNRGPDAQRTLSVTKLKDLESSGCWPIALSRVDGHSFPVVTVTAPAGTLHANDRWWEEAPAVPDEIMTKLSRAAQEGRGVETARWIWRALVVLTSDGEPMTRAEVAKTLLRCPGSQQGTSTDVVRKACKVMEDAGVAYRDGKTGIVLDHWARPQ